MQNDIVVEKTPVKIEREQIKTTLTEMCKRLSTEDILVEATEDTRKLDSGIVYYIVHIKKPDARRTPTRKTGIYFTKVGERVHVQVINGTSMIMLFSNYSDNSQTEVFRYLENMIRKDMDFYQDTLNTKKPRPARKEGRKDYGRKN